LKQSSSTRFSIKENTGIMLKQVSYAFILITAVVLSIRQIYGEDIGFHLSAARWMIENASFIYTDPLTYTAAGHEYIDLNWLYQLLVYGVYSAAGSTGLILFNSALIAGTVFLLLKRAENSS
jgi:hypothetical protein